MYRKRRSLLGILPLLPMVVAMAGSPVETIVKVADKVLEDVRFHYNLSVATDESYGETQTLDFSRNFSEQGVACALSTIVVEKDTLASLKIGNRGNCKVYLNGKEIFEKSDMKDDAFRFVERDVRVGGEILLPLSKGTNSLLIKSLCPADGRKWRVYLRPSGLNFTLKGFDKIDESVVNLSKWLMLGTLPEKAFHQGDILGTDFIPGTLYEGKDGRKVAWMLPRIEVVLTNAEIHQPWGEGYTAFNYHAGGLAWAMEQLGDYIGQNKYNEYCRMYCDFYIDKIPYLAWQKYELNTFNSYDNRVVESFLLDFTAAPLLPFTERLLSSDRQKVKPAYRCLFEQTKDYVLYRQVRTPEGNFMRETPEKYTVWTDDMYMGIPFLVQAARLSENPAERDKIYDDVVRQVFAFNSYVYNKKDGLYQHAQYLERKVNQPYWLRANGWALWAVTHLLTYLPETHHQHHRLLQHYRKLVKTLTGYQDASGLWHNVINRKDAYLETSGSAIFACCIARGVRNGWLPGDEYTTVVLNAWQGIESMIGAEGEVHNICIGTMCSDDVNDYLNGTVCTNDTHGLFPVIFAAIEIDKLLKEQKK